MCVIIYTLLWKCAVASCLPFHCIAILNRAQPEFYRKFYCFLHYYFLFAEKTKISRVIILR